MNDKNSPLCDFDDAVYGVATIGERGQIVIPAEARTELGLEPGDKVMIVRHFKMPAVMIMKISTMRQFLNDMAEHLDRVETREVEEPF
jgi:AbrB family looped-hinge helix DNA binding protein